MRCGRPRRRFRAGIELDDIILQHTKLPDSQQLFTESHLPARHSQAPIPNRRREETPTWTACIVISHSLVDATEELLWCGVYWWYSGPQDTNYITSIVPNERSLGTRCNKTSTIYSHLYNRRLCVSKTIIIIITGVQFITGMRLCIYSPAQSSSSHVELYNDVTKLFLL